MNHRSRQAGDARRQHCDGLTIRKAKSEDATPIQDVVAWVLDEYGLVYEPHGADRDLANPADEYAGRGGLFVVVQDHEGNIVGCSGLFPHDERVAEVRKMYLRAEVRGLGLGGELLRLMIAEARRRGFQELILETASVLKEAIALYERAGFVQVERERLTGRCDRTYAMRLDAFDGMENEST